MAGQAGELKVVVNHEEQYSIWPADRDVPPGWREAGKQGTKAECLAYIEEVWTDMRPLSVRSAYRMEPGSTPSVDVGTIPSVNSATVPITSTRGRS